MVSIRLMPRDEKFFDLFVSDAENLAAGARALDEIMRDYDRLDERVAAIQAIEHAGDELGDEVMERLERAFITPVDRGDIHELARRMDDVLDRIQEVAETLQIYGITAPTDEARRLSEILAEQTTEILAALRKLESMKGLEGHLKRVHELENEADGLSRSAIGRLFRDGQDALEVIKWRDVYLSLEEAIDAAEDAAEIDRAHGAQELVGATLAGVALSHRPGRAGAARSRSPGSSAGSGAGWDRPRSRSGASARGRRRCAFHPRSRSPRPAPATGRG